jgi:hypothetical protein
MSLVRRVRVFVDLVERDGEQLVHAFEAAPCRLGHAETDKDERDDADTGEEDEGAVADTRTRRTRISSPKCALTANSRLPALTTRTPAPLSGMQKPTKTSEMTQIPAKKMKAP